MRIYLLLSGIMLNLSWFPAWAEPITVEVALENYRQQNTTYDAALQRFYAVKTIVAEKQTVLAQARREVESCQANFTAQEKIFDDAQKLERKTGVEVDAIVKKKYFDAKNQLELAQTSAAKQEKAEQDASEQQSITQNVTVQAWQKLDQVRAELVAARFQVLQQQIEQQQEVAVAFEYPCGEEMTKKQCRERAMERAKEEAIVRGAKILVDAVSEAKLLKEASGAPQLQLTKEDISKESSGLALNLQPVRTEFTQNGNFSLEAKVMVKGQLGEPLKEKIFNQMTAIPALPDAVKQGLTIVPQPIGSVLSSLPQPGKSFRDKLKDGSLGPEMVWIPAGTFQMGSKDGKDSEKPVHSVTVKSFAMGKYEVTFAEYDQFCEATGRSKPNDRGWGRDKRPVIYVSWEDAKAYTKWLSEQTGKDYQLPSESQWEYACRAGTTTKYWWGNGSKQNDANCDGCGSQWDNKQTAPVGSFKPNPFGLHDVSGNVWEWLEDVWHDNYEGAPSDGSAWVSGDGNMRLIHGGAWNYSDNWLRCSYRSGSNTSYKYFDKGFRISRF